MGPEAFQQFFLWCTVINYGILILWFTVFTFAHDLVFKLHTRWFKLSPERFDSINYLGAAVYKIGIVLFNLTPLIALHILY
jgi:hypothetical protein